MRNRTPLVLAAVLTAAALPPTRASAQQGKRAVSREAGDEFFIVSSVDIAKNQLLLKRPTEVTDLVRVDGATRYLDERGSPTSLGELRAGDTVYIRSRPGAGGALAVEIRKGPMTISELRKRYLQPKK